MPEEELPNWAFFRGGPLDGLFVNLEEDTCPDCGRPIHIISTADGIDYLPVGGPDGLVRNETRGFMATVWQPTDKWWRFTRR